MEVIYIISYINLITVTLLVLSHPHLTNLALSDLSVKPRGRVTSGTPEPQLTSGLQKDTQPQSSNVKHVRTQREEMWPTWHYHIPASAISPERGFSSSRRADWPDWQQRYGYFPWQPAEPAGVLERGGRSCDRSQRQLSSFFLKKSFGKIGVYCLLSRICYLSFF